MTSSRNLQSQAGANSTTNACYPLISKQELFNEFALSPEIATQISAARSRITDIVHGKDQRLLVVIGPCSIHDPTAALDYANRLAKLHHEYHDSLEIVMRCYFRKPRTTIGWTGLINDPKLDGSGDINLGLRTARKLMLSVCQLGLPTATEFLHPLTADYISDLVSWGAIGARTTESQIHREMASSIPCPIGFKNGTDGNIRIAIDAICAAAHSHPYCAADGEGRLAMFQSLGNPDGHLILRGGKVPNYHQEDIEQASAALARAEQPSRVMVDFSHGNSLKQFDKQLHVAEVIGAQLAEGNRNIAGVMVESFIKEGRQQLNLPHPLTYGQSITDGCIGWQDTERLIHQLADAARARLELG
ncbi:3-deoxy-7-phosphoheptulonate synthase [Dongshaea marina]|uniref:3-deoxy-7-phosphoheptulonate synthase n=1 Tax=Dongshaea marina TaxID=2047966 RepID=UPI000D3E927E|nr:3-deoxy-7-phosphoheptulonate synthase [Dongshaea marina]